MTFSALLALCAGNSPVTAEFPHEGHWRGVLMFSFMCAWINGWVNKRESGDLRRHRAQYDVTEMFTSDFANIHRLAISGICVGSGIYFLFVQINLNQSLINWFLCLSFLSRERTFRTKSSYVIPSTSYILSRVMACGNRFEMTRSISDSTRRERSMKKYFIK